MTIPNELPLNILIQTTNTKLNQLIKKANELKKLEHNIHSHLPESLQRCCRIIENKKNCIVLGCESSAFAYQLKFLLPDLLSSLRSTPYGASIASITCRVVPHSQLIKQTDRKIIPCSKKKSVKELKTKTHYQSQLISINSQIDDVDLKDALTALHNTLIKQ